MSSTTEGNSDGEEEALIVDKENTRPSSSTIPESESESEADMEKTILHELNEHSVSALIDLSTPEPPQKSINFIDLNTPGPSKGQTPVRGTPKATSKLLKKVLDPRISISTLESDFSNMESNGGGQSTPMVNRTAVSKCHTPAVLQMSDINESTEVSDQSTIVSNSVRVVTGNNEAGSNADDDEVIPETEPEVVDELDDLFEDAEELAKSDTDLCNTTCGVLAENTLRVSSSSVELDENGDEYIPATQMMDAAPQELILDNSLNTIEEVAESPTIVASPVLFANEQSVEIDETPVVESPVLLVNELSIANEETPSPATPSTVQQLSPEKKDSVQEQQEEEHVPIRTLTPRKSMRTPKKIDRNMCCTPKSLSKVIVTETTERRSPRVSRKNLSLRMEENVKAKTPSKTPSKSLSKSLMISKLQRSVKKSLAMPNKSVVEIDDDSASENEDDQNSVVHLADETVNLRESAHTPVIFENSDYDSDVICIASQESALATPIKRTPEVSFHTDSASSDKTEPVTSTIIASVEVSDTYEGDQPTSENIEAVNDDQLLQQTDVTVVMGEGNEEMETAELTVNIQEAAIEYDIIVETCEKEESLVLELTEDEKSILLEEPIQSDLVLNEEEKQISSLGITSSTDASTLQEPYEIASSEINIEEDETPVELTEKDISVVLEPTESEQCQTVTIQIINETYAAPLGLPNNLEPEPLEEFLPTDTLIQENENEQESFSVKSFAVEHKTSPQKHNKNLQKTPSKRVIMDDDSRLTRSPLQNVSNMVGVRELFKTPKAEVEKNLTGIREMLKTPHTVGYVKTEMVGLKELMKTPGRLFDNPNLVGVKEMLKTPKPKAPLNLVGVKELVNTPVAKKETNYVGVKELVNTPVAKTEANYVGVKELMNIPAPNKEANYVGIKELVNTPRCTTDPAMLGLREMMQTPKQTVDLKMLGVKELMNTPASLNTNTVGVKELFNTPQVTREVNMVGVRELMKTPAVKDGGIVSGLREMLQTPKPSNLTAVDQALDVVGGIFKTPGPVAKPKQLFVDEEEAAKTEDNVDEKKDTESDEWCTSSEKFDKMMKRKSNPITQTYSRKTPAKESEAEPKISPEKKEEVEKWVESIIVASSGEVKSIINNNLQVLSDRYSNVTPSQTLKAEAIFKSTVDEENLSKVDVSGVVISVDEKVEEGVRPEEEEKSTEISEELAPVLTTTSKDEPQSPVLVEEKQPRPGHKALASVVKEDTMTPRTPLRTRRNLRAALEDTPSSVSSTRTRRAASIQLEESNSVAKVTPAQRGRTPKVVEPVKEVESIAVDAVPEVAADEQHEVTTTDKKRGRPKAVKNMEEEQSGVTTPSRRGRRPKVEESSNKEEANQNPEEKLEEPTSVAKETPARRGRKPKVVEPVAEVLCKDQTEIVGDSPVELETVQPVPEVVAEEKPEAATTDKKRGRPKAVKKLEEEHTEVTTPSRRGRKPKGDESSNKIEVVQKPDEEAEAQPQSEPTEKKRGRGKAVKKLEQEESAEIITPVRRGRKPKIVVEETVKEESPVKHLDSPPAETPVKRRGRPAAVKKQVKEEETTGGADPDVTKETVSENSEEVAKPVSRGRGRRAAAAKVDPSESEQTTTEAEETTVKAASTARGRKKKVVIVEESTEVEPTTESELSPVEQITESVIEKGTTDKPKPTRGRKAAQKKVPVDKKAEVPETQTNDSVPSPIPEAVSHDEKVKLDGEEVLVKKPTRGRKAAIVVQEAVDSSMTGTPEKRRGRKASATPLEKTESVTEADTQSTPVVRRGRGKRAIVASDVTEPAKRAKKPNTDSEEEAQAEVEMKPRRRGGRPKKEEVVEESASSTVTKAGRGRKVADKAQQEEEHVESEKETTADESTTSVKTTTRGKRAAVKRTVEEKAGEEEEPSRKTRVTRRKN